MEDDGNVLAQLGAAANDVWILPFRILSIPDDFTWRRWIASSSHAFQNEKKNYLTKERDLHWEM